jgi:predicted house-cleaning noncanonical NTP pyrophosphatase (MazG superfamily)
LNYESSKKYDEFGASFEDIYYMPLSCEYDMNTKLALYKKLQEEINKYSQKESIENVNYFTELIYICFHCFFEDNLKRINKIDLGFKEKLKDIHNKANTMINKFTPNNETKFVKLLNLTVTFSRRFS